MYLTPAVSDFGVKTFKIVGFLQFLIHMDKGILYLKVAVNVSGGEQTLPQIMADFSLFVH